MKTKKIGVGRIGCTGRHLKIYRKTLLISFYVFRRDVPKSPDQMSV